MRKSKSSETDFPWWLLILVGIGSYLFWRVLSDDLYAQVLQTLSKGIGLTLFVTLVGFGMAAILGLLLALAAGSRFVLIRQGARLYIEVVRGIPIIVLLLYVAFALAPALVELWNWIAGVVGVEPVRNRDFSLLWRAIIACPLPVARA